MISVLDTDSAIRHTAYRTLIALGWRTNVFYSPEAFLQSSALETTSLLILGKTNEYPCFSEAIREAVRQKPELLVFQLASQLGQVCEFSSLLDRRANSCEDVMARLSSLRHFLHDPVVSSRFLSILPVGTKSNEPAAVRTPKSLDHVKPFLVSHPSAAVLPAN